ncbi:MAG: family 78 glycoside hydrolase catalytic domain [Lachnospiraceae bacterium]|nr:family 78 glycoside hydrolase catalytic domain [Lachnospiraceae bacterium]
MKALSPQIQNYPTHTGIGNHLIFAWKYSQGHHIQTAYRIDIFHKDSLTYTTGKVLSDAQNNIKLQLRLEEQTKYNFIVSVWDENSFCESSEREYFITGVMDWHGNWIGNNTTKPLIARQCFIARKTDNAVLSLCVPGQFEVKINGRKISPYVYEGSQTDFNKHVHYTTYDVAEFIADGKNEITIEAANGWYIGDDDNGRRYFYTMDKGYTPFGHSLSLIAQLKIDGKYIATDHSWEIAPSKTVLADIYGSEDIDNTIDYKWSQAQYVKPPKGKLIPSDYPPVIHKYCYIPQSVDKKRMIFDFGQNMSSQFCLTVKGNRGQKIKLIPAEKLLPNGDIEQTSNTYSILTLSGDEDVFEQKFSVNGARWYKLEGVTYEQIIELKSYFTTSQAEDCGHFSCSDERLNKIYMIILKAMESNLNHSHTDCPTIEKLGWLEPNHLMAKAIMYNKSVNMLWSKIAMDMRDAQYTEREFDIDNGAHPHEYKAGLVPSIAPRYARFITDYQEGSFWDIIPWGSSIILAAYEQYLFYNNRQVLEDNYESAKRYLEYLSEQYHDYNRLYNKNGEEQFIRAGLGDWGFEQNKGRSQENIETAYYYHDLIIMAKISEILNKGEETEFLRKAEQVKYLYNKFLLISDKGAYYKEYQTGKITQANQAIPLCFGLVPDEYVSDVESTLIHLCEHKHLECGEIGLVYILRSLANANRNDIIYNMILKDTHPSYLRFVENGETTLPEFWRDDARSRNHDMMGHIMEWFFTEVAGIKSDDGFKTIHLRPNCTDFIDDFECVYNSIRGKISVTYKDGNLNVSVPMNCKYIS